MPGIIESRLIGESPPVRPAWLHAYMIGNRAFPQSNLGIPIALLHTLMNSGLEVDWTEFANSRLTFAQLDGVMKVLDRYHLAQGLEVPPITTERISNLWGSSKLYFFQRWGGRLNPDKQEYVSSGDLLTSNGSFRGDFIENFQTSFNIPYSEYWENARTIIAEYYEALFHSDQGLAMSKEYRDLLVGTSTYGKNGTITVEKRLKREQKLATIELRCVCMISDRLGIPIEQVSRLLHTRSVVL